MYFITTERRDPTCEGDVDQELLVTVALDELLPVQPGLPGLEDGLPAVLQLLVESGEVGQVDLLVEGVGQPGLLPHLARLAVVTAPTSPSVTVRVAVSGH